MRKTTGISLLLLIFLSLCLITFSLLSLSGATADEKLSQKAAEHTAEYYAAASSANVIVSYIDEYLLQMISESASAGHTASVPSDFLLDIHNDSAFQELLSTKFTDSVFTFNHTAGISSVTFTVPVTADAAQVLQVTLKIDMPQQSLEPLCQITAWQVRNSSDWNPDRSLNLLRTFE